MDAPVSAELPHAAASRPTVVAPLAVSAAPPSAPAVTAPVAAIDPSLWDDTLNFFVNGAPVTVTNPDPTVMLVDFLRDTLLLKGTKVRCAFSACPSRSDT